MDTSSPNDVTVFPLTTTSRDVATKPITLLLLRRKKDNNTCCNFDAIIVKFKNYDVKRNSSYHIYIRTISKLVCHCLFSWFSSDEASIFFSIAVCRLS